MKQGSFVLICNECGNREILEHKKDPITFILTSGYECVIITCQQCQNEIVIGGEPLDDVECIDDSDSFADWEKG